MCTLSLHILCIGGLTFYYTQILKVVKKKACWYNKQK